MQFWDLDESIRTPVRFDLHDRKRDFTVAFKYLEFDRAPQSDALFKLPDAIVSTCNHVNGTDSLMGVWEQ